jgi:hypothetical protein
MLASDGVTFIELGSLCDAATDPDILENKLCPISDDSLIEMGFSVGDTISARVTSISEIGKSESVVGGEERFLYFPDPPTNFQEDISKS